ncbi:MAG: hypothetical protein ABI723_25800 [Bacteroidia bacterium]
MRTINNLEELKIERIRLTQKKMNLEVEIESDFKEIKHHFSPARLVPAGISNLVINRNHGVVNEGIGMLVDVLLRKVLFRNAGFITKLIVPMIARTAASNYVSDHKGKIINWVSDLILKPGKKKRQADEVYKADNIYDQSTADFYD